MHVSLKNHPSGTNVTKGVHVEVNVKDQFRRVNAWRAALGLLPVPLRENDVDQRFALLNGSAGNFCLDFVGDTSRELRAGAAWSSDVGHYLTLDGDRLLVTRWDKPSSEETYSLRSVLDKIHEFHRYLEKESPSRGNSVVAHVLQVFRQIRSIVSDDINGQRSLQVLLHLLASAAAKTGRIETDPERWGLTDEALTESFQSVSESRWTSLQLDLCGLGQYDVLSPDVSLILRHASGAVFEEAHRAAILPSTFWLPGLERPATLSGNRNSASGVFFTPAALARTLAEEAILCLGTLHVPSVTVFDPACGSGELLRECLRLLRLRGYEGGVNLIGWDISPAATQIALFVLNWEQRSWSNQKATIRVELRDSLDADVWPTDVDLVIMNPPFLGWTKMSEQQKNRATSILGTMHLNRPNLAMLFSARAIGSVKLGGILASIAPNSLLESSSGSALRKSLASEFAPRLIARLGNQNIFADALVDAGIYIGKKAGDRFQKPVVLWSDVQQSSLSHALRGLRMWHERGSDANIGDDFSIYQRDDVGTGSGPWIAREYNAWQFYSLLNGSKKTVPAKRLFDIRQGVRMGDDAFVVTKEYFKKLTGLEKDFFRPAVMNPSITEGKFIDSYYIFYPNTAGLPQIDDETQLMEFVPTFAREILLPRKQKLAIRKSLHDKARWWTLSEHRNWLERKAPRIVSKYFGRERAFAFDPSGDCVVVVGNSWTLKSEATGETNLTAEEIYCAMIAFLNSSVFKSLAHYTSVQVAGGQLDLSNRYVEHIPVPSPAKMNRLAYAELIELGRRIAIGDLKSWKVVDETVLQIVVSG